jgi:hypothetical protein
MWSPLVAFAGPVNVKLLSDSLKLKITASPTITEE